MLARYIAIYKPSIFNLKKQTYLLFFLLSVVFMAIIYYLASYYHIGILKAKVLRYDQPLVILSAVSLIVYFSKLVFRSQIVNWIAASSFAVFLLHTNPNLCKPYFVPAINHLYANYEGLACILMVFFFLITVFIVAILIDQLRILFWNKVEPYLIK